MKRENRLVEPESDVQAALEDLEEASYRVRLFMKTHSWPENTNLDVLPIPGRYRKDDPEAIS